MKKFCFCLVLLTLFIPLTCFAECSNEDISKFSTLASKIKVDYEIKIEEDTNSKVISSQDNIYAKYRVLNIYIENMSENLTVKVSNESTGMIGFYSYDNIEDGVITIKNYDLDNIETYTFEVYISNDNAECMENKIRTLYLTTPKYNIYSSYVICEDLINELYYCNRYVTSDFDENKVFDEVNKYQEKKSTQDDNKEEIKEVSKIKWNFKVILTLGVIVIIVFIGIFFKKKKVVK